MKKVLIALLLPALLLPAIAQASDVPDEQFVISYNTSGESTLGVVIEDSQKIKNAYSSLQAFTSDGTTEGVSRYLSVENCTAVGTKGCEAERYFNYMALLSNCDASLTTDCVQSVQATDANGKALAVNFISKFPAKMPNAFTGNPELNLPSGGSSFIVNIPDAPHKGGTQYLIAAHMQGNKRFQDQKFGLQQFNLGIFAVSKITGRYMISGPALDIKNFTLPLGGISGGGQARDLNTNLRAPCVQMTESECYIAWPMPQDIEFGITLKLHTRINGWLHGRTSQTVAEISTAADGDQVVRVAGHAMVVPTVFASYLRSQLPATVKDYYDAHPEIAQMGYGAGERDPVTLVPKYLLKAPTNYTENELPEVLAWYTALKDTAPYAATEWSIRSAGAGNDPNGCFKSTAGLSGIVSTNSNFFISGPPVYSKENASLDYKVASPHFLPNGDVFKGVYNLLIKSEVARCIYGFSSAPISASVSVVSADGNSQVATTVLGEKNGWLYLTAAGFTFSSPTVRVKLTQEFAPSPTPEMTSQANSKIPSKKITLTCVKGKFIKKISGSDPKCPTGYKKKG